MNLKALAPFLYLVGAACLASGVILWLKASPSESAKSQEPCEFSITEDKGSYAPGREYIVRLRPDRWEDTGLPVSSGLMFFLRVNTESYGTGFIGHLYAPSSGSVIAKIGNAQGGNTINIHNTWTNGYSINQKGTLQLKSPDCIYVNLNIRGK